MELATIFLINYTYLHVYVIFHTLKVCYVTIHNGTQLFYSDRLRYYYSYEQVLQNGLARDKSSRIEISL